MSPIPKINKQNFKKPFCKDFSPTNGFIKVKYVSVVDGDTAYFEVNGFRELVRFNVIDTPKLYPEAEENGLEAMLYTKHALESAKEIYLESDKYNNLRDDTLSQRLLAWVWYDGHLLNYELVAQNLATVKYIINPKMKYLYALNKIKVK